MEDKEIIEGNITRYCKPLSIRKKTYLPAAFQLREGEQYLSAYLLEYFKNSCEPENVKAVKKFMERKHFSCRKNGGFAVLNIDRTKQHLMINASQKISFKEKTLPHGGIFFSGDDLTISKLLAQSVHALYLVKDLKNGE